MLTFASNKKKPDPLSEAGLMGDFLSPVSLVAGTRFHLNLRSVFPTNLATLYDAMPSPDLFPRLFDARA